MPRTLVVPLIGPSLDPDGASLAALPVARALIGRLSIDVEIVLVSVLDLPAEATDTGEHRLLYPTDALPYATHLEQENRRRDQLVADCRAWLEEVAETFPRNRTRAIVRFGDAAAALLEFVGTLDDPLVVMASHARRGVRRLVLGSVASAMVMRGNCQVLIVPVQATAAAERFTLRRVLVPLDGSLLAEQALDDRDRPGPADLQVHLVQVLDILDPMEREDARRYLESMARHLRDAGYATSWSVRHGDAAVEIVKEARERDADLIVMATHGLGGLRRVMLGSVAERVVQESRVPVLLVRPDEDRLRRQHLLAESSVIGPA